ncbi:hypothetical protein K7X08_008345 [Anisodus acutangulus]|uniref:Brf1 TBP-binding domain-containing protein n=1 Tax=Anisodus acutangulus TaxID=402998 RepID=A0A9Q1MQ96_9SOLA|nr:hypothetical protein K7X08_008345 [Anisodus acutangulus]
MIDEFNTRAEELEKEERLALQLYSGSKGSGITEVLCEHKESVKLPFAHGLCESCYTDFVKLSGGLDGGSEPPAFQRAERERLMANEDAEEIAEDRNFPMSNQVENNGGKYLEPEKGGNTQSVTGSKNVHTSGSEQIGLFSVAKTDHNVTPDTLHGMDGMGSDDHDESDNFSDIDDVEVDGYLHNEQEKRYKKIIWETMNREYLEERQQKRAAELKNSGPAQSAAEATKQMLTKKGPENTKKTRHGDDSTDDNEVKSDKIDPEVDETYDEALGEDLHYDDDVGGYGYDQHYDY